jgi:hypothetical protein
MSEETQNDEVSEIVRSGTIQAVMPSAGAKKKVGTDAVVAERRKRRWRHPLIYNQ